MKLLKKMCFAGMLTLCLASVCHAEEATHVTVADYMPAVKTVYVDDDFNNQQGETPVAGGYTRGVQAYASEDIAVMGDDSNKYLKLSNYDGYLYPIAGNTIKGNRLTISFDVKNGYGDGDVFNAPVISIGRPKDESSSDTFARLNTWNDKIQGQFDINSSDYKSKGFTAPKDEWFNVTVTFERRLKADASAYEVFVTECVINGKSVGLNTLEANASSVADWWTSNGDLSTLSIRAVRSKAGGYTYFDNLLIYEPEDASTLVTKPDYMPEIKQTFADDSFENRPVSPKDYNTAATNYAIPYPVTLGKYASDTKTATASNYQGMILEEESGNKYLKHTSRSYGPYLTGSSDTDRLAVSVDLSVLENASSNCDGYIYVGEYAPFYYSINKTSKDINIFYNNNSGESAESSSTHLAWKGTSAWHKVSFVFKRAAAENGYDVYLESFYVDNTKITNDKSADKTDILTVKFSNVDWWSEKNMLFGVISKTGITISDNILVYEPSPFIVKGIEAADGAVNIEYTDNIDTSSLGSVSAAVTDAAGNRTELNVTASGRVLTAAFGNAEPWKKGYILTVSGLKNTDGYTAADYSTAIGSGFVLLENDKLSVVNGTDTVMTGKIMVAAYKDGKLINVYIEDGNTSIPAYITSEIPYTLDKTDADKYTAFMWDMNSLKPLFGSVSR
ncbi:MAG: hypothetical protein J6N52_08570 [Clostridia bacterium]|nr:hypothetical protein [Clostridia bacterium]